MDGAPFDPTIQISTDALDRLMPMHVCLSASGHVLACGPTLRKLAMDTSMVGRRFFDLFEIRRPGGISDLAGLRQRVGSRLYLALRGQPTPGFRGVAMPLADGQGLLLNLSFGISIIDAVRSHALTDADFAATDLAVELLYVVEAKSAVTDELRQLNLRLHQAKIAAEEQALTDTLTGLRNRRALDIALTEVIASGTAFGVMHIDLDYFKAVNDTMGHAAGDHVLREVAGILCSETRVGDTVARAGGDEFVVVLPGLADVARLTAIACRIIAALNEPIDFAGRPCRISASVGMTISSFYAAPIPDQMLADADQALYACKHAGRGRALMHQPQAPAHAPDPGVPAPRALAVPR